MRFLADSMLGKLAKWLRVMGHDTLYQRTYWPGDMEMLMEADRRLITRHRERAEQYAGAVLLHGNAVSEQLAELNAHLPLGADPSGWFTRCIRCNCRLQFPEPDDIRENVPDFVFHQNSGDVRVCPSCGRYFWPGTHRRRMLNQLAAWGLGPPP